MATNEERINAAIVQLEGDSELLHDFMHNPNPETVTTESGVIPTISKLVTDLSAQVVGVTTEAVTAASSAAASASTSASKATLADGRAAAAEASASNAANSAASVGSQVAAAIAASEASATSAASALTASQASSASAQGAASSASSALSAVESREPLITAGNAGQFFAADKTFKAITKANVGLQNVDNTSDADKPVSNAQQTAITAIYVSSVADLRATTKTGLFTAGTRGYYGPFDLGNGMYDSIPGDTTTLDNGATIIVNAAGTRLRLRIAGQLSVRQCGAKGDGSFDDTSAIQATLNASTNIFYPDGNYVVTGPMTGQYGTHMRGAGMLKVRIQRKGVWDGDTFTFGNATGSIAASEIIIDEMLFEQLHPGFNPSLSPTTMTDRLTGTQGHITIYGGYNCQVSNVWFQHGVYGVSLYGCVKTKLFDIHSHGSWDNKNPNICEHRASIRLGTSSVHQFNTETRIERPYLGTGFPSALRTITVGTDISYQAYENIGPKTAILVEACEGLEILNGYVGGCGEDTIQFIPANICTMINIDGMFLDECYRSNICFYAGTGPTVNVTIGPGNRFNGQFHTRNCIRAEDNTIPTVYGLTITGGMYQNCLESAIVLVNAKAVTMNVPTVNNYNAKLSQTNSAIISAGAYIDPKCHEVHVFGGLWGGGTNDWSTTNGCKWGPLFAGGATSGTACNVRAILGIAGGGAVGGLTQTYPA